MDVNAATTRPADPHDSGTEPRLAESGEQPITFLDHDGTKYVFPYEAIKNWNSFKSLLEDVYRRQRVIREEILNAIRDDMFNMMTEDKSIILPQFWPLFVRPGSTVQISFMTLRHLRQGSWQVPERRRGRRNSRSSGSTSPSSTRDRRNSYGSGNASPPRHVTFEGSRERTVHRHSSHSSNSETSSAVKDRPSLESDRDEEFESVESESVDEWNRSEPDSPSLPDMTEPFTAPMDSKGNELSFAVNVAWRYPLITGENIAKQRNSPEMSIETLNILKAVSVAADGKTGIQIHTLPGPQSTADLAGVNIRWYHLHSDRMDFSQFRNLCSNVNGISENLRKVVAKTLDKVEKEKLKAFLGGMFIEPGTVLRGDQSQKDPEAESAIFSCIPYLDIQKISKSSPGQDRLHPAQTLMQTLYPYEPVRERDLEQAYQKFGNGDSKSLIHVPLLWMMNIGSQAVVTCGHQPLSAEFVKSMEVIKEDFKPKQSSGNIVTCIRLTDWEGRILLYEPHECQTYFEMMQKLRELRIFSHCSPGKRIFLASKWQGQIKGVDASNWRLLLNQTPWPILDVVTVDEEKESLADTSTNEVNGLASGSKPAFTDTMPPFFRWTSTSGTEDKSEAFISDEAKFATYLGQAEKTAADNFKPYEDQLESTKDEVNSLLADLSHRGPSSKNLSLHHQIIMRQCNDLVQKANDLVATVHASLKLFVEDVGGSSSLRKIWGSTSTVVATVKDIRERVELTRGGDNDTGRWYIRLDHAYPDHTLGEGIPSNKDEELNRSIRRCKKCKRQQPYENIQDAMAHVRKHIQKISSDNSTRISENNTRTVPSDPQNWICSYDELKLEKGNAAYLDILTEVNEISFHILKEAKELVDGVRKGPEGSMSEIYTLPRELVGTFRLLLVFYIVVGRAFSGTTEIIKQDKVFGDDVPSDAPFSYLGSMALGDYGGKVRESLGNARNDLCDMSRSSAPAEYHKRLSFGAEYICSFFIRRLIVKPLERSMTVGDMYREYLSTLQFQVNHRPGKRLLRSINLLQEELHALQEVNMWQTRLVENYIAVLDSKGYIKSTPTRRAYFPYESQLLNSCLEFLALTSEEYYEQILRCGPLSESTKQSAEINEEDHGKAILVFTVVTIIFLPLSFVTSYLGMNTVDIRDMNNKQSLFWQIAIPLTAVTMGSILFIAYNGDELRDRCAAIWRQVTGRQDESLDARGISVAQRKRAGKLASDSSSTLDSKFLNDDAEYTAPAPSLVRYALEAARGGRAERVAVEEFSSMPNPVSLPSSHHAAAAFEPISIRRRVRAPSGRLAQPGHEQYGDAPPAIPSSAILPEKRTINFASSSRPVYHTSRPGRHHPHAPPEPAPALFWDPPQSHRPTYMKASRKYLDPETLTYFGLPWEVDKWDSEYIIILREMGTEETDRLFEHTRLLRRRRAGNVLPGRRNEGMWVGLDWLGGTDRKKSSDAWGRSRRGPDTSLHVLRGRDD